ncbi:MAG: GNAT family protein [Pseudomonadota bacterium]
MEDDWIDPRDRVPGWREPPRPARAAISGRYVSLEPLTPARHAAGLFTAFDGHGALWRFLPYGPFATAAEHRTWLEAAAASDDPLFFAICDGGRAVGLLSFLRIAPEAGSIEVGHICLSPALQRTRGATEAIVLTVTWAFEAGYRRFEWKCDAANRASRSAAERFGFSFEGVFRQAAVVKGRNRDTAWFAAIDAEWPRLRAAYDTWLDPANFDGGGTQERSLSTLTRDILAARDPAREGDGH